MVAEAATVIIQYLAPSHQMAEVVVVRKTPVLVVMAVLAVAVVVEQTPREAAVRETRPVQPHPKAITAALAVVFGIPQAAAVVAAQVLLAATEAFPLVSAVMVERVPRHLFLVHLSLTLAVAEAEETLLQVAEVLEAAAPDLLPQMLCQQMEPQIQAVAVAVQAVLDSPQGLILRMAAQAARAL